MKQNEISSLPPLAPTRYENLFEVYNTKSGHFFYNINKTLHFPGDIDPEFFDYYEVDQGTHFTTLSYKVYGTIDLWWLILLANNIQNPMLPLPVTATLRVVKPANVAYVIERLNS